MIFKSVPKGHPANPFEAFRQLVYTVGAVELAGQMGLKPGTLYNKADADEETHHQPNLRDVMLATRLTGDMRVIDSMNEAFGRAAFDISHMTELSDKALLELALGTVSEFGDYYKAALGAIEADRFDVQHHVLMKAEMMEAICAMLTLTKRFEGLIDART